MQNVAVETGLELRVPPHSSQGEEAALGCMMLDKLALEEALELLNEQDFYEEKNRKIFRVCKELSVRDIVVDLVTVSEELSARGLLEGIGGAGHLANCIEQATLTAHVKDYCALVRKASILRELISAGSRIVGDCYEQTHEPEEILDRAEKVVYSINEKRGGGRGIVPVADVLQDYAEEIERLYLHKKAVTGLSTGFVKFDEMTSGLQPGTLTIVAARPGVGKTSFALNIAEHVAIKNRLPVVFYSLEMSQKEIVARLVGSLSGIDLGKLRTGYFGKNELPTILKKMDMLAQSPFFIDNSYSSLTPMSLRSSIRRFSSKVQAEGKGKLALIVIDYLQLMHGMASESRQVEVSGISRSLKELALELNIPILALSQLNRGPEEHSREGKPRLSDLRESGSLEQDADLVAFIYRECMYKKVEFEDNSKKAQIIIAKHRNGLLGEVDIHFIREQAKFVNVEMEAA